MKKNVVEQQSELLEELAKFLFSEASSMDSAWEEVFFDFRIDDPKSGCGLGRTILRTSDRRFGITPSIQLTQIRDCLWELRDRVPGGDWFGLSLRVDKACNIDVKYNHDPDCIESFFDDEKAHRPF